MMVLRFSAIALILVGSAAVESAANDAPVDFSRDIQPLLSDNCFRCHGPDAKQRQAGLRLDLREEAVKALDSGANAIVPGKPEASAVVARIMSSDEGERMPPADSQKKLTEAQKQLLRRWIAESAPYAQHWSFV